MLKLLELKVKKLVATKKTQKTKGITQATGVIISKFIIRLQVIEMYIFIQGYNLTRLQSYRQNYFKVLKIIANPLKKGDVMILAYFVVTPSGVSTYVQ